MHADPQSFRFFHYARAPASGKRSFCIEPVSGEPWALVTQGIHDPPFRGATVRLSLAQIVEVGATLEGRGRAYFDDARLEVVPGLKNPV